jgi:hypothetical protein
MSGVSLLDLAKICRLADPFLGFLSGARYRTFGTMEALCRSSLSQQLLSIDFKVVVNNEHEYNRPFI